MSPLVGVGDSQINRCNDHERVERDGYCREDWSGHWIAGDHAGVRIGSHRDFQSEHFESGRCSHRILVCSFRQT